MSKQKEIELVYEICKYKGYNLSEFEIDNFFVSNSPIAPTIQIIQQNQTPPQNPGSTASVSNNNMTNSITSSSTTFSLC